MLPYNVELDGKTVLVTGAAGFIGSNLVRRLFYDFRNIKLIGIDSITDYYDVNIKYERLKEIELLNRDWTFVMRWSIWFMLLHHQSMAVTRKFRIQLMTRLTTRLAFMQQQRRVMS